MKLQLLEKPASNQLVLISGSDVDYINVPESYREPLFDTIASDRHKGIYLTQTLLYSQREIYRASRMLYEFFGANMQAINKVVGQLMLRESLTDLDSDALADRCELICNGLFQRYGDNTPDRRRDLVGRVFCDPVVLEACALHWKDFITSMNANLLDQRYNSVEEGWEFLFEFKGRHFLVANCDTGNIVTLPVGKCSNCQQAQEWLAGDTVKLPLPKFRSKGRS